MRNVNEQEKLIKRNSKASAEKAFYKTFYQI